MAILLHLLVVATVASAPSAAFDGVAPIAAPPTSRADESRSEVDVEGVQWLALFDGRSLEGWKGDRRYWSVEDGCIVGRSTPDLPCSRTTYLQYVGKTEGAHGAPHHGVFRDFEIVFEIKLEGAGANSGLQYRSTPKGPAEGDGFDLSGYQADIDAAHAYTGILYETYGRGIAVGRGEAVRLEPDGTKRAIEPARPDAELKAVLLKVDSDPQTGGWHQYRVVANGRRLEHWIDGERVMLAEDHGPQFAAEGIFALQIHQGPPMTVRVRNIRVRTLNPSGAPS